MHSFGAILESCQDCLGVTQHVTMVCVARANSFISQPYFKVWLVNDQVTTFFAYPGATGGMMAP